MSLFNTIVTFFGFTVGLSTAGYFSVSFFKNNFKTFKIDLTSILIITLTGSLILCTLILALGGWVVDLLKLNQKLLLISLYLSLSSIIFSLWLDYFRVRERVLIYGLLSCGFALLNFLLTLLFIVYCETGWLGFVYSQTICNSLIAILSLIYFFHKHLLIKPNKWAQIKKVIMWGLPLVPHAASTWIKQGIDRYIIDFYYSMSDVGLFSFALNLANIIVMVGVAFNQTNSVSIYKILSNKDGDHHSIIRKLHHKESLFVVSYIVITLFVILLVSVLVPMFIGKYIPSIKLFYILSIFGLSFCCYLVYCNYLFYFNKTVKLMKITFGLAIIHLILSLILTKYSLIYTCIIYLLLQTTVSVLVYIESRKLLKKYEYEEDL